MHALQFLAALSDFFEQSNLPLRIQVMEIPLSDNESKVDYITIRLLITEYNHAVRKMEEAVNQNDRNANQGEWLNTIPLGIKKAAIFAAFLWSSLT